MLDSLDTLIAFTLIFTVVSLLITIIVRMISSAMNLRGKNLAWAISEAFEAIAPELAADVKKKEVKGVEAIKQWLAGWIRGFFPKTTEAKKLADHCLDDTLISDSQFMGFKGRASAVRTDELFELLHRIATDKKPGTPDEIKKHVLTLFTSLGVPVGMADAEKAKLNALKDQLIANLAALPDTSPKEALQTALKDITDKLAAAAANATAFVERWAAQGEDAIKHIYEKFEHLFETGQERAQEWFTTHARIITAILGVAFAFLLQLDTFEIFKTVSTNRAMRDKLVAQTTKVLTQAGKTLGDDNNVLKNALEKWKKDLKGDPEKKINAAEPNLEVQPTDTRESLRGSAEKALGELPEKPVSLAALEIAINESAKNKLKEKAAEYNLVKADIDGTGFDLFPGWRWGTSDKPNGGFWHWIGAHVCWCDGLRGHGLYVHRLGILASALLLSLGAPFWFNILKSLSSLRSSVASNISEEKKADQKSGKADKPSNPPPGVMKKAAH